MQIAIKRRVNAFKAVNDRGNKPQLFVGQNDFAQPRNQGLVKRK
jgi:hypothetical protein